MAKAREITELDCDAPVSVGAKQVLVVRWEEMREFATATAADPSFAAIHDMRVATRRLRSAFRDFRPFIRGKVLRRPMKEVRSIAGLLGMVRDEDVMLAALARHSAELEPGMRRDGIQLLAAERHPVRNAAVDKLLKSINENDMIELSDRFRNGLDRIGAEAHSDQGGDEHVNFRWAGRSIIAKSLVRLQSLSRGLYQPNRQRPLHRMRIGAKQLRYALELSSVCWGGELAAAAHAVKELQTVLGDLHDRDVWIAELGTRLKHINKRTLADTTEIERAVNVAGIWLLGQFTRDRAKYFHEALTLWHIWESTDIGGRLSDVLGRDGNG